MSFRNEVSICRSQESAGECSKEKLLEEYLNDKSKDAVESARAKLKPGDVFTVELPTLSVEERLFIDEFHRQLTWKNPYVQTVNNLDRTLSGMSPAQAAEYVREKLKQPIVAPRLTDFDPSTKRVIDGSYEKILNDNPQILERDNISFEGAYKYYLRKGAATHFDKIKRYEEVREFAKDLQPDNYYERKNEFMQRPEIAISSAQQRRFLQIFDKLDENSDERVSERELTDAIESRTTSPQDKEMLEVVKEFRDNLAHAHDDSIFLAEWNISRQDMQHIGERAADQPGKLLRDISNILPDASNSNPWMLVLLK